MITSNLAIYARKIADIKLKCRKQVRMLMMRMFEAKVKIRRYVRSGTTEYTGFGVVLRGESMLERYKTNLNWNQIWLSWKYDEAVKASKSTHKIVIAQMKESIKLYEKHGKLSDFEIGNAKFNPATV